MSDEEEAIVFHVNITGRILHMECFGGAKPFKPVAQCLTRKFSEILPGHIGQEVVPLLVEARERGYRDPIQYFYKLDEVDYEARIMYHSHDIVLVVVVKV